MTLHTATRSQRSWTASILLCCCLCRSVESFLMGTKTATSLFGVHYQHQRIRSLFLERGYGDDGGRMVSLMDDDDDDNEGDSGQDSSAQSQEQQQQHRHIPTSGISVSDEMEAQQTQVSFVTDVVPLEGLPGVAQLVSHPIVPQQQSFEPIRYLVPLSKPTMVSENNDDPNADTLPSSRWVFQNTTFVMVDIPPYSPQLVTQLKAFMGLGHTLAAILVTNSDAIHCDETPTQLYAVARRGDLLQQWKRAFPEATIVASRLETPRDCRTWVTQQLDGQGPFAWNNEDRFEEMGRPLQRREWDHTMAQRVLQGTTSPEEATAKMMEQLQQEQAPPQTADDDVDDYSKEAIRKREEGRSLLASCTPGHSYGSLSFVFPNVGVVCTGFTLPVEDNRADEHEGYHAGAGPALDVRGYITTSRAGIVRQMESARQFVQDYGDRFWAVLPSRGAPLLLDPGHSTQEERQEILLSMIDPYDKIGQIYEQLGITSTMDTNDDEDMRHP